jgi:hypothetical protein
MEDLHLSLQSLDHVGYCWVTNSCPVSGPKLPGRLAGRMTQEKTLQNQPIQDPRLPATTTQDRCWPTPAPQTGDLDLLRPAVRRQKPPSVITIALPPPPLGPLIHATRTLPPKLTPKILSNCRLTFLSIKERTFSSQKLLTPGQFESKFSLKTKLFMGITSFLGSKLDIPNLFYPFNLYPFYIIELTSISFFCIRM